MAIPRRTHHHRRRGRACHRRPSTTDGTSSSSTSTSGSITATSSGGPTKSSKKSGSVSSSITSDPTSVTYSLAAFAIGDWGTTVTQDSCCQKSGYTDYDINAEDVVASDKFDGDNIKTLPWVNVLNNHDYGGADYICSSGDNTAKCSDGDELVAALNNKFSWQSGYTSPNDDRWILEDHFYVYTIEDSDAGVSIDIFNVDSNDADSHGALKTCCQCYGYAGDDDDACDNVARGDDACCGGDTDMYDACKHCQFDGNVENCQ
ncbi:uncharacterized protein PITG_13108 [Phytophthora infestans T30-4]|uniref:Calcineurin-like phosphoesterase domain-containing protein n=1 Tax=Phytophthora infestans (strain T30-4) TaxID=403677 RepID=D0NKB2_PHYIT|nr:uncharacterized protein PITG_13108 [Phytophthora infestans T30-4]EEY59949.1 conserved hypothetical protein [Phytophthora infestans T30-4]|eukprot:XP_002900634.1 conserved hypothetical protein [Phytophthora infestans T30-4]